MRKLVFVAAGLFGACVGSVSDPGTSPSRDLPSAPPDPSGPDPVTPYEPLAPAAYAAKVKDVLTGLPLTDAELQAASGGAAAMRPLIDAWMATPQYRDKMLDFWKRSFQQTQFVSTDLDDQLKLASANVNRTDQQRMLTAVQESFARTVLALVDEGRPFTETVTTTRFMMNLPMMVALAYMDAAPRGDSGNQVGSGFWIMNKYGGPTTFRFQQVTNLDPATGVATSIPFEETIDSSSPNFMKWSFTQPDPTKYMPCAEPVVATGTRAVERAFGALFGSRDACQGAPSAPSQFTDADWATWRMVEVRKPNPGEDRTLFWDLPRLRDPGTRELVLATPRLGFLTTPAFFANWPTNVSNSYRVTTNQALIVALGRSFDDRSNTVQVMETTTEAAHVQPGTTCYGCHQVLDPMRDFYKQSYSLTYFQQLDLNNKKNPLPAAGTFVVEGSGAVTGVGVETLARAIAQHPSFATAWAEKLCHLANSSDCRDDDPELVRVAGRFRDSHHDWKTLVRELFSSPLVTYAERTKTAETDGVVIAIARREALCARLSNRLGLADVCNLNGQSAVNKGVVGQVANLSVGIAGSPYSRADVRPVMPHDPNLFFVSATEKLCGVLAGQLVETMTGPWKVAARDAALADFVHVLMGAPGADARAPLLLGILGRHYDAAVAAKETPADALRSTFVLACSSPLAVSVGL
jgi:hypothetical protein